MTKKQLEIDNLIRGNGLMYSYVARNIRISRQTLNNQLNHTVEIKMEYYIDIKNFVNSVLDKPPVKEKEVVGLSLVEQIILLREKCLKDETELRKLKHQIIQLKKDCGHKEGCLVKNIKLKNEE